MKKYTLLYIAMLLLATSCNEQLPPQYRAQVGIEGRWNESTYSFDLKGSYTLSEGNIQEAGFIYQSSKEQQKTVSNRNAFEVVVDGRNFDVGTLHTFYSYVRTPSGLYRSEAITLVAGTPRTPVITSTECIVYDGYTENGSFKPTASTIVIKGTGFSTEQSRNSVYINGERTETKPHVNTPEEIQIQYRAWYAGKVTLHVRVGSVESEKTELTIPGITIEETSPKPVYFGQELTIRTSGISLKDNFKSLVPTRYNGIYYTTESMSDNEMKIFFYPEYDAKFYIMDKHGIRSNEYSYQMYSPWKEVETAVGYAWHMSTAASRTRYFVYETDDTLPIETLGHIMSYDVSTGHKTRIDIDIDTQDYSIFYPVLFVYKDYLYALRQRWEPRYEKEEGYDQLFYMGHYFARQDMCRMSLSSGKWEWLNDPAIPLNDYVGVTLGVDEESGMVYLLKDSETQPYIYYPESDSWEKASFTFNAGREFAGCYDGYLYYTAYDRALYRIKEGKEAEIAFDMKPFVPSTMNHYITHASIVNDTCYFYYYNGVFSIPLSGDMTQRPTAWGSGIDFARFIPYHDKLFAVNQAVYQFEIQTE
jgi:hypothetical protein